MFSFTIAAVVLITGINPHNGDRGAEFKYIKNDLKFETLEECEDTRSRAMFGTSAAQAVQGLPGASKCKEVK